MAYRLLKVEEAGGLDEAKVKEMESLNAVPGERELKRTRLNFIETLLCNGEFNRCEWARCKCKEDKKNYRVNGQHTTTQLRALLNGEIEATFPEGVPVVMSWWECDSKDDLPDVFNQFDNHRSTRSAEDKLGIYLAQHKDMIGIDKKLVNQILAGVDWARKHIDSLSELFGEIDINDAHERGRLLVIDKVREFAALLHEYSGAPFREWISRTGIIARLFDLFIDNADSAELAVQQIFFEVGDDAKKFTQIVRSQMTKTGKDQGWYYRKTDGCVNALLKSLENLGKEQIKALIREVMDEASSEVNDEESVSA